MPFRFGAFLRAFVCLYSLPGLPLCHPQALSGFPETSLPILSRQAASLQDLFDLMEITTDILLKAYAIGVFPMAESQDATELHWIDPRRRGILPLNSLHIPRSLRKTLRKESFQVHCNTAFMQVMEACAEPRPDRSETWINPQIKRLYQQLFQSGFAHSVECWKDGRLVGGLYGVSLGSAFFGESMFSRETNASKVALVHLVARLEKSGYSLLDTQFLTSHLARFGVIEVSRETYHQHLGMALQTSTTFDPALSGEQLEDFIRSCQDNLPAPPPDTLETDADSH